MVAMWLEPAATDWKYSGGVRVGILEHWLSWSEPQQRMRPAEVMAAVWREPAATINMKLSSSPCP